MSEARVDVIAGSAPGAVIARPIVRVVAGALRNADGDILIADRPAGKPMAGRWEFPGGKLAPEESPEAALCRELDEELGIRVLDAQRLIVVSHRYADAPHVVEIDCWRVLRWEGVPVGREGQRLRWCPPEDLPAADILEADAPIVTALRLPPRLTLALSAEASTESGSPSNRAIQRASLWVSDDGDRRAPRMVLRWSVARLSESREPGVLVGVVVTTVEECRAAAGVADFLLVHTPSLTDAWCAVLTDVSRPWYVSEGCVCPPGLVPIGRFQGLA
jgi:mutator protein MutT